MQDGNPRSAGKSMAADEPDDLLECRMAMLGIDALESADSDTLDEIKRRCLTCCYREACAVDLERDPNNPVWETYCPNAEALIVLAEAPWLSK